MAGAVFDGGRQLPHEVSTEPPEGAWVQLRNGGRVDLVLTRGSGPGEWVASPPDDVGVVMVRRGDRLNARPHPGQSIRFDRVWSAAGDVLVVEET